MCWLQSHTHLLSKESPPVPAACGDVTGKEVGLGMTPKSVSFKAVVWATAVSGIAQPSLSQTPWLDTSAVLEAAHSQEFCSVWTSNRRQQELGIAGLKYDLKFNFFFLCLQNCLILSCLYSSFYSWSGGFYFVLRSSMNRSCLWGRWVLVHHLY